MRKNYIIIHGNQSFFDFNASFQAVKVTATEMLHLSCKSSLKNNLDYIAECKVTKSSQYAYIKIVKIFFSENRCKSFTYFILSTGDKWISPVVNTFNTFI